MLEINVNGTSIDTSQITAVEYTDETGDAVDALQISGFNLSIKEKDQINVKYTSQNQKFDFGFFEVEKITTNYRSGLIGVEANQVQGWGQKYSRTFSRINLFILISQIAAELKLKLNCDLSLTIEHEAQSDETNYQFLNRLAKKHNAYLAIKSGQLIFKKSKNINSAITLRLADLSACSLTRTQNNLYKKVKVTYRSTKTNSNEDAVVGEGKPVLTKNIQVKSSEEALTVAKALYEKYTTIQYEGSVSLLGCYAYGGQKLKITGNKELEKLDFQIKTVRHNISPEKWSIDMDLISI